MNISKLIGGVVAALLVVFAIVALLLWPSGEEVELQEGKAYELAYTHLADLNGLEGRKFDFRDRSLKPNSKIIPLRDARGVSIVIEDSRMTPGTLKKVRKTAPARVIEGEKFPAQSWQEYHFNFREKSPQDFVPSFK